MMLIGELLTVAILSAILLLTIKYSHRFTKTTYQKALLCFPQLGYQKTNLQAENFIMMHELFTKYPSFMWMHHLKNNRTMTK